MSRAARDEPAIAPEGSIIAALAPRRSLAAVGTAQIAAVAMIVDALNDGARAFDERYDFRSFADDTARLYLPMHTIAQMLDEGSR